MNLPNKITTSRFFITVAFVVVLLFEWQWATTAACLLFLIGGLSDIADGEIARRRNLKTDFGILMDPLADKIMVCAGFIVLVGMSASTHPYISEQPNIPHVPRWLEVPACQVYWYGKEVRPGRKLGHININHPETAPLHEALTALRPLLPEHYGKALDWVAEAL